MNRRAIGARVLLTPPRTGMAYPVRDRLHCTTRSDGINVEVVSGLDANSRVKKPQTDPSFY